MRTLFVALLLFLSLSALAQKLNPQFEAQLNAAYKPGEPGATALVAKGGKPIYRGAVGMADLENNVALRPDHVFEIGSITKQFTAVSILMLMEQGKLRLEDPLTKFIPDYPKGEGITVHHLLTHTSGIKSYTSMEAWAKRWREDLTPLQMIDIFKNEPMDFAPGEKWSYNNSAYFILGYIIEKTSGVSYAEFLEKNIFVPLGMKNTSYGSQSKIIKNRAQGYQRRDGYVRAEYLSLTQPYAAGSIMSTVDDLLLWQLAINRNQLIRKETQQLAYTPVKLNNGEVHDYGYGWGLGAVNGSPTREHSGGIFGYSTNEIYLPNEDVYVAVFSNCDCSSPTDVSARLAGIAIGKPYLEPVAKVQLNPAYAQSLAGTYDFADGSTRIISAEGNQLFSQRGGSGRFKIFPQDKTTFSFETGLTSLRFVVADGKVKEVRFMDRSGKEITGQLSTKVATPRVVVAVKPEILGRYVGTYELMPNFNLVVTLEGGRLMSEATGQPKAELFGMSDTRFFLKDAEAEVEFVANAAGTFDLVVYDSGQKMAGKRKG